MKIDAPFIDGCKVEMILASIHDGLLELPSGSMI
jgi:hypothetical protein